MLNSMYACETINFIILVQAYFGSEHTPRGHGIINTCSTVEPVILDPGNCGHLCKADACSRSQIDFN